LLQLSHLGLQLLCLLFVPALILLPLLPDRAAVMLERLPRMFMFLLKRLAVLFIFVQGVSVLCVHFSAVSHFPLC
jgi:hypothetical protein